MQNSCDAALRGPVREQQIVTKQQLLHERQQQNVSFQIYNIIAAASCGSRCFGGMRALTSNSSLQMPQQQRIVTSHS
jgi:hypothetical protein